MLIFVFSPKTVYQYTLNHTTSTFRSPICPEILIVFRFLNFWPSGTCAIDHLMYLHIISLCGGAITCSNQNSGVGHVDSFQFFYFILKAVVVQSLPQEEFQEWKCWTKCSTHWNFWSILPTCDLKRLYNFTFLPVVFAYLYTQTHLKSSFLKHLSFAYT